MKRTAAPNLCGLGSTPRPGVSTSCVCWIYSRDKDYEVFRVAKTFFPSSGKKNLQVKTPYTDKWYWRLRGAVLLNKTFFLYSGKSL